MHAYLLYFMNVYSGPVMFWVAYMKILAIQHPQISTNVPILIQ